MRHLRDFIMWTLNSKVSPLAYLAAYSSLAIGFFWTFFQSLPDIKNTLLYKEGLIIGNGTWGVVLFVASITLGLGLKFKKKNWVRYGAMVNFMMWLFAANLYATNQYWYALCTFAVFHMLIQGYFFLAASLDRLWINEYN